MPGPFHHIYNTGCEWFDLSTQQWPYGAGGKARAGRRWLSILMRARLNAASQLLVTDVINLSPPHLLETN